MKISALITLLALAATAATAGTAQAAEALVPAGQAVYDQHCAACHLAGGKGMVGLAPALAGPFAKSIESAEGKRYFTLVMINGLSGRIVSQGQTFTGAMATQAALADADLAELGNYLARDLNGAAGSPFSAEDFATARAVKTPHKDIRELRERLPK